MSLLLILKDVNITHVKDLNFYIKLVAVVNIKRYIYIYMNITRVKDINFYIKLVAVESSVKLDIFMS